MPSKKHEYTAAVGRRKSAIARVRVTPGGGALNIQVNGIDASKYFNYFEWQDAIQRPLKVSGFTNGTISIQVRGGGLHSQSDAIKLGITRALIKQSQDLKPSLRKSGLITRDARVKERKKPGLKRARRAPQWSKR